MLDEQFINVLEDPSIWSQRGLVHKKRSCRVIQQALSSGVQE